MAKRRGTYNGGSTIVRLNPHGVWSDPKPKKGRKASKSLSAAELDQKNAIIKAEQEALRRFDITSGDLLSLGTKLSGWKSFVPKLERELAIMRQGGTHRADQIAQIWNRKKFKTGSHERWTPRLVKIAKTLVAGG